MKDILRSALVSMIILSLPVSFAFAADQEKIAQKAVLVTGASTGIGRKIAEDFAASGHFVYAGARKQKDLDALNAIENIQAIRLDVTVQEEIDAAVQTVRDGGRGLHGLINNAGIFIGGPLIEVDVDELHWLMDVNVYGVYRVTQAFAPLIIESKGRITTIGSISGILSGQFSGQYSMSKHAIEAYTDSLAIEMAKFGVQVSVIEPGNYDSAIAQTAMQRAQQNVRANPDTLYATEIEAFMSRSSDRSMYKDPGEVADAAMHAMFDDNPVRRYMVVPNEQEASATINKAIQELLQLNEYQAYSYTREQLIEKLDAAMNPVDVDGK